MEGFILTLQNGARIKPYKQGNKMPFYRITALYMGTEEISYADGKDYPEVMRECAESIPALYPTEDVTLKAIGDSGIIREVTTPLDVWLMPN